MLSIQKLNNINCLLEINGIKTISNNAVSFEIWMRKIQNMYISDNEAMCAAYDRVSFPNLNIPFVKNIVLKYEN